MKCKEKIKSSSFEINYKKECVIFKDNIFEKKKMGLKEFAITILQIEPISTEVVAMYIGKLGFDVYNDNGKFKVLFTKKKKNYTDITFGYNYFSLE